MVPSTASVEAERVSLQRRTLNVTRLAVIPGQAAVTSAITVISLLATDLLGSDRFAGSAAATFTLGAAVFSVPLAAYMRRHGRRPGLVRALGAAAVGGLLVVVGGQVGWWWLFLIGLFIFGAGQAANYQSRYVVLDLAERAEQARAIGAVVWIGTLGAVFGPLVVPAMRRAGEAIGFATYIGPIMFAAALMALSGLVYGVLLRPDPLVVSGGVDPTADRRRPLRQVAVSYGVIGDSRLAVLGIAAMAISQAVMVAVMTMTPAHMRDHGQATESAFVIALHIVGMYGLAPIVGRFVGRVGEVRAIEIGAVVLGGGALASVIAGYVPAMIFIGLFLLGLGWNVGLIAGTALLTRSVPDNTRVEAQGTGDLTLSLCGAGAAIASGLIKTSLGFDTLANGAAVGAVVLLIWALLTAGRQRPTTAA